MRLGLRLTLGLLLALTTLVSLGLPSIATAVVPFGNASQLLAPSGWPSIGNDHRHTGRSTAVGPETPATRWRTQITRQPGLMDENAFMRSTFLGANGFLYVGAGMAGIYRLDMSNGELVAPSLYSVRQPPPGQTLLCASGETWVEDLTIGADNMLYFVNEGGCAWAVDATTLKIKWQKVHGFLHAPPALYPHPDFGTVMFIMSPDGYVKGLRVTDGAQVLRYRFTNSTGNKEAVREKGFAIGDDGLLYFAWKDRVFGVNPLSYNGAGDMAVAVTPIPIPAASAGPVGPITVNGNTYLFLSGEGTFFRVNLTTRAVNTYNLGSTLCQSGSAFCDSSTASKTGKERWPAVSADGKVIYFSASNGRLYALNNGDNPATPVNDDWKPRWIYNTETSDGYFAGIKSDPLIDANGVIYVFTANGEIHAVRPDGSRKWRSGDYGVLSGVRDSFYFGTNLALSADGTLYVSTTGPNPQNGVTESYVWAVGESGAPPLPTPTPTMTPTRTPTPSATSVPTATATPPPAASPTATVPATATRTPTATPIAGASPTPTAVAACPPLPADAEPTRLLICPSQIAATTNGQPSSGAIFAIDYKPWTSWGSNWGSPAAAELRVTLAQPTALRQVQWTIGSNSFMDDYDVDVSTDGNTWTPLVAGGPQSTQNLNATTHGSNVELTRDVALTARYIRWNLRNPNRDSKIGSIIEIELYRQP